MTSMLARQSPKHDMGSIDEEHYSLPQGLLRFTRDFAATYKNYERNRISAVATRLQLHFSTEPDQGKVRSVLPGLG